MVYHIENPFISASSRDIVEDASFIGREHNLRQIENRVILPERQRGSIAIIGLPDVGKYCLVNKALLARKAELHQRKLVPIEMDLTTYTESDKHDKFFRDLISLCKYELEDEDLKSVISQTINMAQMTKDVLREWDEGGRTISPLKRFFKNLLRAGIRVIFVLNNFDHADSLFKEHIARIRWLRDLAGSECQVTWIALACRPIREIKRLPKSISDDFFSEHRLGMFAQDDMTTYFRSLVQAGIPLPDEHKKTITSYCGRHPYLLSLLGYHLIEDYNGTVDVERAFHQVEERFSQSYDRIIDLVLVNDDNDEKLQKLWQILSGQTADIEQKDIEKMLAYDLIYPNPLWSPTQKNAQPAYVAFSEHFQNYLRARLSSSASPPILEKAEQAPRTEDPFSWSKTMLPGDIILDRYKIVGQLKTTGHSQVMKAWDTHFERFVAIKRLYLDPARGEETIKTSKDILEREAKILGGIRHANIGMVYDFIKDPPTIVMQWIEGKSLDQTWEQGNGLPTIKVIRLGIKLAKALVYIHTKKPQVIHRDIKPENILMQEDGEPILIDFDVARAAGGIGTIIPYDEQGKAFSFAGTLDYGAPEQFTNPHHVTDRADIYALGLVLYEALTGGDKLDLSSHREIPQHLTIPAPLWQILRAMLSKDPRDRPNAQQLCRQLERCLQRRKNA